MKVPVSILSVLIATGTLGVGSRAQIPAGRSTNFAADGLEAGGPPSPEVQGLNRSRALQEAIGLTLDQTNKIAGILTQEAADCQAMGPPPWPAASPLRQRARDQIRALLTPEQRSKFNLVPESHGGGLIGLSPWQQLAWLDKQVHLAPEQKPAVLRELIEQTESLMENRGPEKAAQRQQIRGSRYAEIRALLTPEQQQILDGALAKHGAKLRDLGKPEMHRAGGA